MQVGFSLSNSSGSHLIRNVYMYVCSWFNSGVVVLLSLFGHSNIIRPSINKCLNRDLVGY